MFLDKWGHDRPDPQTDGACFCYKILCGSRRERRRECETFIDAEQDGCAANPSEKRAARAPEREYLCLFPASIPSAMHASFLFSLVSICLVSTALAAEPAPDPQQLPRAMHTAMKDRALVKVGVRE